MSKSIRISDELLALAKASAEKHHRSPPQQIEHWAAIGQVLEPALDWPMTSETKNAYYKDLLNVVETEEGKELARSVILNSNAPIVSLDDA